MKEKLKKLKGESKGVT